MISFKRPLTAWHLLPLAGGALLLSLSSTQYLLLHLFLGILLLMCLLYVWFSRHGMRIELQAPTRVNEGDRIRLLLCVHSPQLLPRFITPGDLLRGYAGFHAATDETRRVSPLWRAYGSGIMADSAAGVMLQRGCAHWQAELDAPYRGIQSLRQVRLELMDPFGIFSWSRRFRLDHEVLVRIRPALPDTGLHLSVASGLRETQGRKYHANDMQQYAGARPYRIGDEPRHIHWPTVARTGELYIREFTPDTLDSILVLILRNPAYAAHPDWPTPPHGEPMLKAAISMIMDLFNRRIRTGFGDNIGDGHLIAIEQSEAKLEQVHDAISALSWEQPATVSGAFLVHSRRCVLQQTTIVAFCVDPPEAAILAETVRVLRVAPHRCVIIAGNGDGRGDGIATLPPGMRLIRCGKDDISRALGNLVL